MSRWINPKAARWLWLVAAAAAVLVTWRSPHLQETIRAALAPRIGLATLAVLPVQIGSTIICGVALKVLRPGASTAVCIFSRWLRDAGGNLLVFAPGIGEISGARILVLRGASVSPAISASALDVFAETIAQVPFAIFGVAVTAQLWRFPRLEPASLLALVALVLVAAVLAAMIRGRRHGSSGSWIPAALLARLDTLKRDLRDRSDGMPIAVTLHGLAWSMGGLQVWVMARLLGFPLSLFDAIALESLVYAARACLFMVPAGLGVQEASFIGAGLLFGLHPQQALAISFAMRARDLVFGLPALMAWLLVELRRAGPSDLRVRGERI